MKVHLDHLVAPVTAVQFCDGHLLAGIGPDLHIYRVKDETFLQKDTILGGSTIHGITIGPATECGHLFCVYGGKKARIVTLETEDEKGSAILKTLCPEQELHDWVWCSWWLLEERNQRIALCLSHNTVACWDWKQGHLVEEIHCEDKCILYSANLIGNTWHDLVVLAGTVFCQVEVWAVNGSGCGHQERQPVLHTLTGHQGVIFSVSVDAKHHHIASVSDDRSIRLYHVTLSDITPSDVTLHDLTVTQWREAQFDLQYVLYGHAARVWDIVLLTDCMASVGEDATCCVWNYSGQVIKKYKGHRGKSIWSLAADESLKILATGGGDGGIRLWQLPGNDPQKSQVQVQNLQLPDACDGVQDDFPRTVKLPTNNTALVMTNNGCLQRYTPDEGWTVLLKSAHYNSYSVLGAEGTSGLAAVGNIEGCITLILNGRQTEHQLYTGKVFSLLLLDSECHMLTTGPDGQLDLWDVNLEDLSIKRLSQFFLPYTKQRWVAAAAFITRAGWLVCGDRGGTVHVYSAAEREPKQSLWKLHGKAGVTDVCYHDNQVYTSGRDGRYRVYDITEDGIHMLQENRVFKGFEWISRLVFLNGEMLVVGFYTDQFLVFSVTNNQTLLTIPCGGGHRAWDFSLHGNEASFLYIKTRGAALCHSQIQRQQRALTPSLHGKEITCIKHLTSITTTSGVHHVCVTGSEDTLLNVVVMTTSSINSQTKFKVAATLQGHISSVRALAVCKINHKDAKTSQFLLFSGGGRAQLCCWKIQIANETKQTDSKTVNSDSPVISCETVSSHMLRPQLSSRNMRRHGRPADPETRFMALTVFCLTDVSDDLSADWFCVVGACSDASVRLFLFDAESGCFHDAGASTLHNHCVLVIDSLIVNNVATSQRAALVITGATDGQIIFWNITQIIKEQLAALTCTGQDDLEPDLEKHGDCDTEPAGSDEIKSSHESYGSGKDHSAERTSVINVQQEQRPCLSRERLECRDDRDSVPVSDGAVKDEATESQVIHQTAHVSDNLSDVMATGSCHQGHQLAGRGDIATLGMSQKAGSTLQQLSDCCCHQISALHQSGINSLSIYCKDDNSYLIATGGDDNALCVQSFELIWSSSGLEISVVDGTKMTHSTAHAAQITGLDFMDERHLLSSSIDQRVCVWILESDTENNKIILLTSKFILLADGHGQTVWQHGNRTCAALCGVGIQLLHTEDLENTIS